MALVYFVLLTGARIPELSADDAGRCCGAASLADHAVPDLRPAAVLTPPVRTPDAGITGS